MPLTAKGEKILAAMQEQYGEEEGKRIFYASKNAGTIEGVDAWSGVMRTLGVDKEFSAERRQELAKSGKAMKGGGFPIENEADLKNAIRAFGRAGNKAAAKAHIKKRARALGKTELLPENWDSAPPDWIKFADEIVRLQDAWEATDAWKTCPTCGGNGKTERGDECPTCEGTGAIGIAANLENDARRRRNGEDDDDEDDDEYGSDDDENYSDARTVQMFDRVLIDAPLRTNKHGFLVTDARIARTGIQVYTGHELGVPEMQTVRVYRPPEEVFSKRAMHSMAHMPVTLDHPPTMVDKSNWETYAIGNTADEVTRDGDCVRVPMMVCDGKAIDAITKDGVRELSVGYSTEIKWGRGKTPDGERYDARQTAIRGNHLAVVPAARGGSRLRIGDDLEKGADMLRILIDGQSIEFNDELAAKHVQRFIATLQKDVADARKKAAEAEADEEEEEEKKTRAETDAATLRGENAALKKQLEDTKAQLTGKALDKIVKERTELMLKADAVLEGKVDLSDKEPTEIMRTVVQAKLGDAAKDMTDHELIGAFKALTANIKPRTGTDRLADSLGLLNFGGGNSNNPKAIKDAAYNDYVKNLSTSWRAGSRTAQS